MTLPLKGVSASLSSLANSSPLNHPNNALCLKKASYWTQRMTKWSNILNDTVKSVNVLPFRKVSKVWWCLKLQEYYLQDKFFLSHQSTTILQQSVWWKFEGFGEGMQALLQEKSFEKYFCEERKQELMRKYDQLLTGIVTSKKSANFYPSNTLPGRLNNLNSII